MKFITNLIFLIFFMIFGYLSEVIITTGWVYLTVCNRIFSGQWGALKIYGLDVFPAVVIYLLVGLAFYLIIIDEKRRIIYWLIGLGVMITILKINFTGYSFSKEATIGTYIEHYSKLFVPLITIIIGGKIGSILRKHLTATSTLSNSSK